MAGALTQIGILLIEPGIVTASQEINGPGVPGLHHVPLERVEILTAPAA
jgi:hypothetical protein